MLNRRQFFATLIFAGTGASASILRATSSRAQGYPTEKDVYFDPDVSFPDPQTPHK